MTNMTLQFKRTYFDPEAARSRWKEQQVTNLPEEQLRARRYEDTDDIVLAVNAALATRRPLLVYGSPGSGKSTLAGFVAEVLGWRYYEHVITSRTQAQELLWTFDAVRRLSDAQVGRTLRPNHEYVEPGVLWWAGAPESATRRGADPEATQVPPPKALHRWGEGKDAVVLLDEIDKADPFVPNDLLVPIDTGWFDVTELNRRIRLKERQILLVITTNGERELAPAFLRRCVQLELKAPGLEQLKRIATLHFESKQSELYEEVAKLLLELRKAASTKRIREPSTAEFLDAIQACRDLKIQPGESKEWRQLSSNLLEKHSTFAGG